jgi:hypothetical protein
VHKFRLFNHRSGFRVNLLGHHVQKIGHLCMISVLNWLRKASDLPA